MNKSSCVVAMVTLVMFLPQVSRAELSSSVKVRVRNSSNYVYPCNAGIALNPRSVAKGVDYIRASWMPSQHNPTAQAGSGVAIGGSLKNNNPDPDYGALVGLLVGGTRSYLSYNELLPENLAYDYVLGQNLSGAGVDINLSSDTYNSAFYITFCFKPSQNPSDSSVPLVLKFVHAKATHSVVPGGTYNYATDAKLTSMVEIKCRKSNGSIIQHYTPGGVTAIDALLTPFAGNVTVDMAPSGGIEVGSGLSLISGSALEMGVLPDDCRIRFYFIETAGTLRPHAMTQSDIQVDLEANVGSL